VFFQNFFFFYYKDKCETCKDFLNFFAKNKYFYKFYKEEL